ncbi:MAG: hypothetical protein ACRD1Z_06575 [Vicinamibacteria bacterium]
MRGRSPSFVVVLGIATLLGSPLAGCAREWRVVKTLGPSPSGANPYIGMTREKIEEMWGHPDSTDTDDMGNTVLVYLRSRTLTTERPKLPEGSGPRSDLGELPEPGVPERTTVIDTKPKAKFYLDKDGTVTKTWFDAKLWKEGMPKPADRQKKEGDKLEPSVQVEPSRPDDY